MLISLFSGTLMNIITVIVLTRPSMISPVNVLLCAVAVCDIIVMASYLVFVIHFLFMATSRCEPGDFSYGWAIFTSFHANISVICHSTSIWLTVSLAQIRVLTIKRATHGPSTNISEKCTFVLAIVTLLIMTLITEIPADLFLSCFGVDDFDENNSIPFYPDSTIAYPTTPTLLNQLPIYLSTLNEPVSNFTSNISDVEPLSNKLSNIIENQINISEFLNLNSSFEEPKSLDYKTEIISIFTVKPHAEDCMNLKLAFWSNGMIFKVVPCILLTLSIVSLVKIIADVGHKRKNLAQIMKRKVPKDHTTPMLAAVLFIFLVAELPQGLMLVLTGIFSSETFNKKIYMPLGDFMDLLSLLNSAIGFVIYVGMSRKFRSVFLQLFPCQRLVFFVNYAKNGKRLSKTTKGEAAAIEKRHSIGAENSSLFFNYGHDTHGTSKNSSKMAMLRAQQQFYTNGRRLTADNTKTEQLSHYFTSTQGSSINLHASNTTSYAAMAGISLGGNLLLPFGSNLSISNLSETTPLSTNRQLQSSSSHGNFLSVNTAIQKRPLSTEPTSTGTNSPDHNFLSQIKPTKKIFFNFPTETDGHSGFLRTGLLILKTEQELLPKSNEDPINIRKFWKQTEKLKSIIEGNENKRTMTIKNGLSGFKKLISNITETSSEKNIPTIVNTSGSASPQRRKNLMLIESSGCII